MHKGIEFSSSGASSRLECIMRHVSSTPSRSEKPIRLVEPTVTHHPKTLGQGTQFPPTTPGVLRIYSMRFCPFAQRTKLILEHKKIPHETININLKYKPDWFLQLSPLGKVPVLQLDDMVIPESTATCDWLDENFSGPNRLTPQDSLRRAWDRVLLENVSVIGDTFYAIRRNEDLKQRKLASLEKRLDWFENILTQRRSTYFGGSEPAMVDFLLWPHFERLPALGLIASHPKIVPKGHYLPQLATWMKAMHSLPAVKATMMDDNSHAHWFASFGTGTPDYDYGLDQVSQ